MSVGGSMQHDCDIDRKLFDVRACDRVQAELPIIRHSAQQTEIACSALRLSVSAECGRTAISRFDADSGAVVSFRIASVSAGELGAERSHFSQGGGESCTLTSLANTWMVFVMCARDSAAHISKRASKLTLRCPPKSELDIETMTPLARRLQHRPERGPALL